MTIEEINALKKQRKELQNQITFYHREIFRLTKERNKISNVLYNERRILHCRDCKKCMLGANLPYCETTGNFVELDNICELKN